MLNGDCESLLLYHLEPDKMCLHVGEKCLGFGSIIFLHLIQVIKCLVPANIETCCDIYMHLSIFIFVY